MIGDNLMGSIKGKTLLPLRFAFSNSWRARSSNWRPLKYGIYIADAPYAESFPAVRNLLLCIVRNRPKISIHPEPFRMN
jgi:hypothetical protein